MARKIAGALASLGLILAGCEDGAPEQNVTAMKVANPQSDQLKALSEPMRNLGLYRAVRDSGRRCKRVDYGLYQQDYKNLAMWVARCSDTGDHAVFIGPNGDVQVSRCADMATVGLPLCRDPTRR